MKLADIFVAYNFQMVWSPELFLLILLLATFYLLAVGRFRGFVPDSAPVPFGKKLLFMAGLFFAYTGLGSPLNLLGHFLFSAHMLQQALLYLVMPPLLLLGTPDWLLRYAIQRLHLKKAMAFFTHPVVSVLLFNALFSFYHMPLVLDSVMKSYLLTNLAHFMLIASASLMWFTVLSPLPELNRLTELRKLACMFANGVLLTPACALIIFADDPLYATYLKGPEILCTPFYAASVSGAKLVTGLSTLDDQQLGGIVMKLLQEFIYISVLAWLLFAWFKRENADEPLNRIDPGNV